MSTIPQLNLKYNIAPYCRYTCPGGMFWNVPENACDWYNKVQNCQGYLPSTGSTTSADLLKYLLPLWIGLTLMAFYRL